MKLKLLFASLWIANLIYAQENEKVHVDLTSKRAQSVYGELGGNGILFSANYDVRFTKSQKGFGARVGVGYIANILTLPVGINYLAGRSANFFEGGVGYTYLSDSYEDHASAIVLSAGYRYQPASNGFTARVFISPLIDTQTGDFVGFAGVSFGYKF